MDYSASCAGLSDADGNSLNVSKVSLLDPEIKNRLIAASSRMGLEALCELEEDGVTALCVECEGEGAIDQVALLRAGQEKAELLLVDDGISYEQLSPFQLVEYRFETGSGDFMTCNIGVATLDAYKGNKFNLWRDNMLNCFGGCAAAFLPELRRGYALCNMYDHMIFTSPAAEKADWETEHNGKMVSIPRPVHTLRVWDSSIHAYTAVDARMPGAPDHNDVVAREEYWAAFLQELKNTLNPKYGEEFIEDCLHMDKEEVKSKYGF